jgi:hypothetical protein
MNVPKWIVETCARLVTLQMQEDGSFAYILGRGRFDGVFMTTRIKDRKVSVRPRRHGLVVEPMQPQGRC